MWKNPWSKRIVFLLCLAPFLILVWRWKQHTLGINAVEAVARYTGDWTIRFMMLTLAVTPLRRLPGLNPLIGYRKMFGLFTFFYGLLHALHYWAIDIQWNMQILAEDLTIRRFFIAGMLSLVIMIPLALTSTNGMIRKIGGKRWQMLHRLVYVSAIAGVIHYLWQGKTATLDPILYACLLALLLGARVVFRMMKRT